MRGAVDPTRNGDAALSPRAPSGATRRLATAAADDNLMDGRLYCGKGDRDGENRNTFQKGQREMEKKRKAQEKRQDKQRKKDQPPKPDVPMDLEREREEEAIAD
jgi:hypothetical protein